MSSKVVDKARLNLKIDAELKDWVMEYAQQRSTTVTQLICMYLSFLRQQEEEAKHTDCVDQI